MRTIDQVPLAPSDRQALAEAAAALRRQFPVSRLILFGSKARGDDDKESDIDLLVVTTRSLSPAEKDAVVDAVFETQLTRRVVLSPLVVAQEQWDGPLWRVLPIHSQIEQEGAVL
jgi:predicted nucleotidyltransferase